MRCVKFEMSSKVNVKNVLESLCKILEFAGCSQMVPEEFRLAKLDKPEVVDKFWRLLRDLLAFLERHNNQEIGLASDDGFGSLEFVRKELIKYGYSDRDFFEAESIPSSRLLLVAVGWLLSSQDMLELFVLDQQTYDQILEPNWSNFESNLDPKREKQTILSKYKNATEIDQLNQLKYLQLNNKQIVNGFCAAQTEKARLTAKLREKTRDDLVLSDPVNELLPVAITRRPLNILLQYQQRIERENEFYKSYLMFTSNEQLFWEWMETVVDEQMAAKAARDDSEESPRFHANSVVYSSNDVKRLEYYQQIFQKDLTNLGQYLDIVREHAKLGRVEAAPQNDLDLEINSIFQTSLVNSTYFYLGRLYEINDPAQREKLMSVGSFLYSKKFIESISNPKYSSGENRLYLREQIRILRAYLKVFGLLNDNMKQQILCQLNKYLTLVQQSGIVPIQINSSNLALS